MSRSHRSKSNNNNRETPYPVKTLKGLRTTLGRHDLPRAPRPCRYCGGPHLERECKYNVQASTVVPRPCRYCGGPHLDQECKHNARPNTHDPHDQRPCRFCGGPHLDQKCKHKALPGACIPKNPRPCRFCGGPHLDRDCKHKIPPSEQIPQHLRPCRFCGGQHMDRDCQYKVGNTSRKGKGPTNSHPAGTTSASQYWTCQTCLGYHGFGMPCPFALCAVCQPAHSNGECWTAASKAPTSCGRFLQVDWDGDVIMSDVQGCVTCLEQEEQELAKIVVRTLRSQGLQGTNVGINGL